MPSCRYVGVHALLAAFQCCSSHPKLITLIEWLQSSPSGRKGDSSRVQTGSRGRWHQSTLLPHEERDHYHRRCSPRGYHCSGIRRRCRGKEEEANGHSPTRTNHPDDDRRCRSHGNSDGLFKPDIYWTYCYRYSNQLRSAFN